MRYPADIREVDMAYDALAMQMMLKRNTPTSRSARSMLWQWMRKEQVLVMNCNNNNGNDRDRDHDHDHADPPQRRTCSAFPSDKLQSKTPFPKNETESTENAAALRESQISDATDDDTLKGSSHPQQTHFGSSSSSSSSMWKVGVPLLGSASVSSADGKLRMHLLCGFSSSDASHSQCSEAGDEGDMLL